MSKLLFFPGGRHGFLFPAIGALGAPPSVSVTRHGPSLKFISSLPMFPAFCVSPITSDVCSIGRVWEPSRRVAGSLSREVEIGTETPKVLLESCRIVDLNQVNDSFTLFRDYTKLTGIPQVSVLHSFGGRKKSGTGGEVSGGTSACRPESQGEPGDGPSSEPISGEGPLVRGRVAQWEQSQGPYSILVPGRGLALKKRHLNFGV
ncbi:hypothetical protein DY000_02035075 [Brassica cretica]|uniref:Uncharacterized protein n=1 Tax=Brassica cretica TaxID=69181 RepID=A0ABQ7DUA3_BRACR|nr:hypothetical protein DY000_02035075 [Brassica cretica]